eukprot:37389_1
MASCVETEGKEDNTMNSSDELIQWLKENNLQQVISTFKDENMTMDELMEYGEDMEILKQYLGQLGIATATITRICFKIKKRLKNDKNNKPNPITNDKNISQLREKLLRNEQAIKSQINVEYNNLINLVSNNQEIVLRKLSEIVTRKQLEINQSKKIDEVSAHITFEFNKNSIIPFLSNLTTIYGEEMHPVPIIDGIKIVQLTNTQCTVQWKAVLSPQDLATKTTCKLYMKIKAVNDEMDEKKIEQFDSDLIVFDADNNSYEYKLNELRKNTFYKMKICLFQGKKNDKYSIKPREDFKPLLFNFKTLGYDFCAKAFLYQSDYDENGVIWFLGTNY